MNPTKKTKNLLIILRFKINLRTKGGKISTVTLKTAVESSLASFFLLPCMNFTLQQYNHLHLHQKAVMVFTDCTLLEVELEKELIASLFAYSSFFVEVTVNSITKELIDIVAFNNGERLDKYLDKINLLNLIKD